MPGFGLVNCRLAAGKKVLVEGANAAMLDIDFGERTHLIV